MVIVTKEEVSYIGSLGKRVAVVSDYASHTLLKEGHPELVLHPTKDVVTGLEAVLW